MPRRKCLSNAYDFSGKLHRNPTSAHMLPPQVKDIGDGEGERDVGEQPFDVVGGDSGTHGDGPGGDGGNGASGGVDGVVKRRPEEQGGGPGGGAGCVGGRLRILQAVAAGDGGPWEVAVVGIERGGGGLVCRRRDLADTVVVKEGGEGRGRGL